MIKIEETKTHGWEAAIRGMRNPMNSWEKSDSHICYDIDDCDGCLRRGDCKLEENEDGLTVEVGPNDHDLMMRLASCGPVHAKYRRMINVTADITAPLYWWKEFDTYKVGTVSNSCSTMHKIHVKPLEYADFSYDKLLNARGVDDYVYTNTTYGCSPFDVLDIIIQALNYYREKYNATKDKKYWDWMIQLLPSSYNQKRTIQLNYEVLSAMYHDRKNHKLSEWVKFCEWIHSLPYSELITGVRSDDGV